MFYLKKLICPNCKSEVPDTAKFCETCGAAIQTQVQTQPPPQRYQQYINQNYYYQQPNVACATVVDFGGAISRLFSNYFVFQGRATRSEYWWAYLFCWIVRLFVCIPFVGWIINLGMLIPMVSCGVRRLHDAGYSGWYYLFSLIPVVGVVVMIILLAQPSVPDNQWGLSAPGTVTNATNCQNNDVR